MKIINNVRLYRPYDKENTEDIYHIGVENGKISFIKKGLSQEQGSNIVDGKGKVLTAAFNDSHMHLLRFGFMKKEIDLRKVTSFSEMKKIVHNTYEEEKMEEHDWLVGRGLIDSQLKDKDKPLTAEDLEELEYSKPAYFLHDDGHECVLNKEALNIVKEEPDLLRNHEQFIEKDKDGQWTGRFKDTAVHFIKFHFRKKEQEEIYKALEMAIPPLLENGISSVHTDDLNFAGDFEKLWNTYRTLENEGKLLIDVWLHHYIFNKNDLADYLNKWKLRTGDGSDQVKIGAVKIFLDGTQRLHTSALREPYSDRPHTRGTLIYSQEELRDIVQLADENNMQVAMHAIGDRAVEQALGALGNVDTKKRRHRIIHAQVLAPDLLQKLEEIKPYLETQPGFMMDEHDQTVNWVGTERERYCNPWKTVLDRGIPFTCSSDTPIGPLSPIQEIYAGVNRMDLDGKPEGGWIPEEKLSVDDCFFAYTVRAAELEHRENEKGKIETGHKADFILLDTHPKDIESRDLYKLQVSETWINGKKVYDTLEQK
ncbi:metal-dependent hydrolase [Oceanobacillus iheyensis]|nr:metal-dependent hydrolase [Oceanobacillus iheyensis]